MIFGVILCRFGCVNFGSRLPRGIAHCFVVVDDCGMSQTDVCGIDRLSVAIAPVNGAEKATDELEPHVYTQSGVEAYAHLMALAVRAARGCGVCGTSWCISCQPQYSRVRVFGRTRWVEARGTGWGFLKDVDATA